MFVLLTYLLVLDLFANSPYANSLFIPHSKNEPLAIVSEMFTRKFRIGLQQKQ